MPELSLTNEGEVLVARVTGTRTRAAVESVATEIMAACLEERVAKLLVDVRAFTGQLTLRDDYQIPTEQFPRLQHGGLLKAAAILDLPENHARFVFFEDVARSAGFNVKMFTEITQARKWLDEQG